MDHSYVDTSEIIDNIYKKKKKKKRNILCVVGVMIIAIVITFIVTLPPSPKDSLFIDDIEFGISFEECKENIEELENFHKEFYEEGLIHSYNEKYIMYVYNDINGFEEKNRSYGVTYIFDEKNDELSQVKFSIENTEENKDEIFDMYDFQESDTKVADSQHFSCNNTYYTQYEGGYIYVCYNQEVPEGITQYIHINIFPDNKSHRIFKVLKIPGE